MSRSLIALAVLAIAAPSVAQQIDPALGGQGTQTQNLQVLGAISATVESGGALSVGHGDASGSGELGVSVNGISVGVGGAAGNAGAPQAQPVSPVAGSSAASQPTISTVQSPGFPLRGPADGDVCQAPSSALQDLAAAMRAGWAIEIVDAGCGDAQPELAALIASHPRLVDAFGASTSRVEDVVAITIADDRVIVFTR